MNFLEDVKPDSSSGKLLLNLSKFVPTTPELSIVFLIPYSQAAKEFVIFILLKLLIKEFVSLKFVKY